MEVPNMFAENAAVWVPDMRDMWVKAQVLKQQADNLTVHLIKDKRVVTVRASECYLREEHSRTVDDMTRLAYLHEPGVLHNLHQRYEIDQIYTYTGRILIAVNPYAPLPKLYDSTMREQYLGAPLGAQAPHVFAVADAAYRAMREEKKGQSILISGESGAGKTETTKLVMEYLATVCSPAADSIRGIERMVLESNPLLEAFGNAKTERNNNSSRFGKFIKVKFDRMGRVSGAAILSYLLEKSRVVHINEGERNYHCFYQLCYGASAEEAKKYKLTSYRAEDFRYLNQSSCYEVDKPDKNSTEFGLTKRAMSILQFSTDEQESVFRVVSAILHLGNVSFEMDPSQSVVQVIAGEAEKHLHYTAELLRCDESALRQSLLTSTMKVSGDVIILPARDVKAAEVKRNSLAKNLYSSLFDWIVAKVNAAIGEEGTEEVTEGFIGILDIYGFEHFKLNSFEQLCINLANEKLQQHFNFHVLKSEQEEYEMEEINWSRIAFTDNQDCLDLIEGNFGILSSLDSACMMESTTAELFTRRLSAQWSKHDRFMKPKTSRTEFVLDHYAGKVTYCTDEFITKNKDAVIPQHFELLSLSGDEFIARMFPQDKLAQVSRSKFLSLGTSFKLQLGTLLNDINNTHPHYIRCIKPNLEKHPRVFEKKVVVMQLQSGGVLEAVRMCSAGYPTRKEFSEFLNRFRILAPTLLNEQTEKRSQCMKLLEHVQAEACEVGKSKVFLRAGQMAALEIMRQSRMNAARSILQAVRENIDRRSAVFTLQTWWRGFWLRKVHIVGIQLRATVFIQNFIRMFQQRGKYLAQKQAALICQAVFRALQAKREFLELRRNWAARKIQSSWRGYVRLKPWMMLTSVMKGLKARREMQQQLQSDPQQPLQSPPADAKVAALPAPMPAPPLMDKPRELRGYILMSKMREKAERAKRETQEILETVQRENRGLKSVVEAKEVEAEEREGELRRAQQLAVKAAMAIESMVAKTRTEQGYTRSLTLPTNAPSNKVSSRGATSPSQYLQTPRPTHMRAEERLPRAVEQAKQVVEQLLEENHVLREEKERAEAKVVSSAKERSSAKRREVEAKHQEEMDHLRAKLRELESKLAKKDHELEVLGNHLLSRSAQSHVNPVKQQELLLAAVGGDNNLGFTRQGHPVAAILVFRALEYWRSFDLRDSAIFALVIDTFQQADRAGNASQLSYWLANSITLYSLVQARERRGRSAYHSEDYQTRTGNLDTELFKMKLGLAIVRLYVTLRDNVRTELLMLLSGKAGDERHGGSALSRLGSAGERQGGAYWTGITIILQQLLDTLESCCVPTLVAGCLLQQLLQFINLKIFNSLLVRSRWCPCTYSNGEVLQNALLRFKLWLQSLDYWLEDSDRFFEEELLHLEEAVGLLLYKNKQALSLEDLQELCPHLSPNQLWHICSYFEDDKYNTLGVQPSLLLRLWKLMPDPAPELVADDRSIPFDIEEVIAAEPSFNPDDVEIPPRVLHDEALLFLLPSPSAPPLPLPLPLPPPPPLGLVPTPPRGPSPAGGPSLTRSKASRRSTSEGAALSRRGSGADLQDWL